MIERVEGLVRRGVGGGCYGAAKWRISVAAELMSLETALKVWI